MRFAAPLLAAVLAGCSVVPQNNYKPAEDAISTPAVGSVQEVGVGDEMVRMGRYSRMETVYVPQPMQVSVYTVVAGYFKKMGENDGDQFYLPNGGTDGGSFLSSSTLYDVPQGLVLRASGELCVFTLSNLLGCGVRSGFERRTRDQIAGNGFQQSLVYNGKSGNKIALGYREVSSSVGTPAFNNSIEYDLGESTEIAYKGARIEVIAATPKSIKYRVLRNFQ